MSLCCLTTPMHLTYLLDVQGYLRRVMGNVSLGIQSLKVLETVGDHIISIRSISSDRTPIKSMVVQNYQTETPAVKDANINKREVPIFDI